MSRLLASSRSDVMDLAWALETTPGHQDAAVAAAIISNGLMLGPWWFRLLVAVMRRRGAPAARLRLFYERQPDEARRLIMATCRHIRHGEDREDASSAGGFSQRETDLLVQIMADAAPKGDPA